MQTGKETWKWGVVVLLLAIFLITANQAYQHIASQESFEPPDDWQKGDSWDLEHQSGPGAGQPMQMPQAGKNQTTPTVEMPAQEENSVTVPEAIVANYCGLNVLGISCLTNYAAGITKNPLTHNEVIESANAAKEKFQALLLEILKNI